MMYIVKCSSFGGALLEPISGNFVPQKFVISHVILLCDSAWYIYLLSIGCRCFAALGDVAKAQYLRETHELAKQKQMETVSIINPLLPS